MQSPAPSEVNPALSAGPSDQSGQVVSNQSAPTLDDPVSLLQWVGLGLLRHLGALLAAWLIQHGLAAQSDLQMIVGAVVVLGMLAWSVLEKVVVADSLRLTGPGASAPLAPPPALNSQPSTINPAAVAAILALGALFLSGCAQTVLYSPHTGQRLASFQGDMTGSHYHGGGVTWDVQQVSHSAATLAGGQAFKLGADSVGTAVVSGIMAGGLPWTKAVAGGTQILAPILQTAAPVVLQSKH